jgi:hypothetical protein
MATSRRNLLRTSVLCASLAAIFVIGWIGWRYIDTKEEEAACGCPEDPIDGPRFGLLSPFRSSESEKAAGAVLQAFQSGRCESVSAALVYCEREERFKIVSWKLTGRTSGRTSTELRY